jgi:predicted O-methyltransferase YrrM
LIASWLDFALECALVGRPVKELFCEIARVLPEGGEWCSEAKASGLAALILADRPHTVVEIGVFLGGSFIPIALAMKFLEQGGHVAGGRAIAIDPWDARASVSGQIDEADRQWWALDHEPVYWKFLARVERHGLSELVKVERMTSSEAQVPGCIDLLHIDGNHGEQAIADVLRFAPSIPMGGVLVLDDLEWSGGTVARAFLAAEGLGFRELYKLGTGCVMRRTAAGS